MFILMYYQIKDNNESKEDVFYVIETKCFNGSKLKLVGNFHSTGSLLNFGFCSDLSWVQISKCCNFLQNGNSGFQLAVISTIQITHPVAAGVLDVLLFVCLKKKIKDVGK